MYGTHVRSKWDSQVVCIKLIIRVQCGLIVHMKATYFHNIHYTIYTFMERTGPDKTDIDYMAGFNYSLLIQEIVKII